MEFFRRAAGCATRLAIFPGTFNPVTVAHVSLAEAALTIADEVVFVLPRIFPHKIYAGASFEERIELLCMALGDRVSFSIAASEGGLFVEIAEECRRAYGDIQLSFLCGRDAAERIANWDYGEPGAFEAHAAAVRFSGGGTLRAVSSGGDAASVIHRTGRAARPGPRIGERDPRTHCARRALGTPGSARRATTGARNLQAGKSY